MSAALITGLAALAGALIGGLTTVGATLLTNHWAAKRDQRQRAHQVKTERYEQAKTLLGDFLSQSYSILNERKAGRIPTDELWAKYLHSHALLNMTIPELRKEVGKVVEHTNPKFDKEHTHSVAVYLVMSKSYLESIDPINAE